jgi:hypothetical protein
MRYIQTSNGAFARHIFNDFEAHRWDETHKCSVHKLSVIERAAFGVFRLQLVTPPAFDAGTQIRSDDDALLVNGVWTQNWAVTDLAGDELASAQQALVPNSVTRHQAMVLLHRLGLRENIKSFLNSPGNEEAKIAWEEASEFRRDSDFIALVAEELSLTDEQVDNMFLQAVDVT